MESAIRFSKDLLQRACYPSTLRRVRRARSLEKPSEWFDFVSAVGLRTLRPIQVRSEISELAERVFARRPQRILEIGTARGGTLFMWCRCAAPDATIISVDLPGGMFGGGYPEWKIPVFRAFANNHQTLHLLRSDSHSAATRDEVARTLAGQPLDFLFIDGDHSYAGAKQDFELYSPLVAPRGLIALHDICRHPAGSGGDVHRLWDELKLQHDCTEFVACASQGYGLGLIEVK